jgi:hypothetical protein
MRPSASSISDTWFPDVTPELFSKMDICVLLPEEAKRLEHHGCEYRCQSRGHKHINRRHAEQLVQTGQAVWIGKHKRRIKFVESKSGQRCISAMPLEKPHWRPCNSSIAGQHCY